MKQNEVKKIEVQALNSLDVAEMVNKQQGHPAMYIMDVVEYFPELRKEAEKTIFWHVNKAREIFN